MRFRPIKFGPFPHETVNQTLEVELDAGDIFCSVQAQRHMFQKHAADFSFVLAHLQRIVLEPNYIGQAPRHPDNIEFIKRIAVLEQDISGVELRRYVALAAVGLQPDDQGLYRIRSAYLVDEEDVTVWRSKGNLLIPKK